MAVTTLPALPSVPVPVYWLVVTLPCTLMSHVELLAPSPGPPVNE